MITGEERLRENLTDLYGNVTFYEGRPSQTQIERADALVARARRRDPRFRRVVEEGAAGDQRGAREEEKLEKV